MIKTYLKIKIKKILMKQIKIKNGSNLIAPKSICFLVKSKISQLAASDSALFESNTTLVYVRKRPKKLVLYS